MKNRRPTRCSIYITVLGAAMLVTLIGLSAMMVIQLQDRAATGVNNSAEARLYARSALEMGMYWIRSDPFWRTHKGNGAWATNVPIGTGTFSLEASDPVDGNVSVGASDPVVLIGTGVKGTARYRMQVRIETAQAMGSCLEVPLHGGNIDTIDGATLNCDQIVSSNFNVVGQNGAQIYADVEAHNAITGGTYHQALRTGITARTMPDTSTVMSYYTANGTAIAYNTLRLWGTTELMANTTFEATLVPWYTTGGAASLARSLLYKKDGAYSCRVYSRANAAATAALDLDTSKILNGNRYYVKAPTLVLGAATGSVTLTLVSTGSGTQTFSTPATACPATTWVDLAGTLTPAWTGQLTKATVSVTLNSNTEYYIDSLTCYDCTYPADAYVCDRKLLSPAVNPFGGGQTNAKGIYLLDGGGQKIIIANSRIVGTLVLQNFSSTSSIQGSVSWEPAIPNYPALLTDMVIPIGLSSAALSEATLNTNFNPTGTPYPYVGGLQDADNTDAYPSLIKGIVYSKQNVQLGGQTSVEGVVIANTNVTVLGGTVTQKYNSTWLNNPPPGFDLGTT
ncbi:MAG: carbohydrate binding domain-containing protein [Planctomycetota bacterium]|nr:carbohydrate binding domain-containing protein [Planctomycetota bacterium]